MRAGRDREAGRPTGREETPEQPPASPDGLLVLQRTAGNAAVSRLLQRDTPTDAPTKDPPPMTFVRPGSPLSMRPGPSVSDPLGTAAMLQGDSKAAVDAARAWWNIVFDDAKKRGGGGVAAFTWSVPELVNEAGALIFDTGRGKSRLVREVLNPGDREVFLRQLARERGVALLEMHQLSNLPGVKSQLSAMLRNLGRIPTELEIKGGSGGVTLSVGGTVTVEVEAGKTKVEGELSTEGVEGTVTLPNKTKIKGKVGEEGFGGSVDWGEGKVGIDVNDKGVKAEVSFGKFVHVKGIAGEAKEGGFAWKAEISVGTLGSIVTVDDLAKVMVGAQKTFGESAADLARGVSPEKVKRHGGAVEEAVNNVGKKIKKSAEQAKPGWAAGLSFQGSEYGGVSGMVTLTWVW
jgi:hypothetical protein